MLRLLQLALLPVGLEAHLVLGPPSPVTDPEIFPMTRLGSEERTCELCDSWTGCSSDRHNIQHYSGCHISLSERDGTPLPTKRSYTRLHPLILDPSSTSFRDSKLIPRTLDWMSLYFYRSREFLFHVISTYVFAGFRLSCWSFLAFVFFCMGRRWFICIFFYSCDYIY